MLASKNIAINSAASADLGLGSGDLLQSQLEDELKKRRQQAQTRGTALNNFGGGTMGMANLQLFGSGGSFGG